MINSRLVAGALFAYTYNSFVGRVPCSLIREYYLRAYLGAYGRGTAVQLGSSFINGRKIYLGDRNVINFGCLLDGRHFRITTGNDVSIGPEATILTLGHDPQSPSFALRGGEVQIGNRAWIGYRALILPGVTIGEGVVVAAGAVVTKDLEAYCIAAGNPARVVSKRNQELEYTLNYRPFLQ